MPEAPDVLRREIKVLAFDQIRHHRRDAEKGLTEAVVPFLKQKGWDGKPNRPFVTWWRRTHYENSMIDALRLIGGIRLTARSDIARFPSLWTVAALPTPRKR